MKKHLKKTFIYKILVKYRSWLAKVILRRINVMAEDAEKIAKDYSYSIKENYRTLFQVINIENSIRHVKENNIKGAFVETGTWTGGASAYALLSMMRNNDVRDYWGFDSFEGMPKPTLEDGNHGAEWIGEDNFVVNNADRDACYDYLIATGYDSEKVNLVKGWFQESLSKSKELIGSIAILRLDGDFYESTKVAMTELYPLVVKGGVVIIDDYGYFEGCRKAIHECAPEQDILFADDGVRYFIKR